MQIWIADLNRSLDAIDKKGWSQSHGPPTLKAKENLEMLQCIQFHFSSDDIQDNYKAFIFALNKINETTS